MRWRSRSDDDPARPGPGGALAARARHGRSAHRQPPDPSGGCLHRLARCRHRRTPIPAGRAGARCERLPARSRRCRRLGCAAGAGCGPAPRPPGLRAFAQGADRSDRRRLVRAPERRPDRAGCDRHQRQDLECLVAGAGPVAGRPSVWPGRHAGHRSPATARKHRHDHARPGAAAARVPGLCRVRLGPCRDRGVFHRSGRTPAGWHPHPCGRVHQFHAGSPGLPRQHGGLLGCQARPV